MEWGSVGVFDYCEEEARKAMMIDSVGEKARVWKEF